MTMNRSIRLFAAGAAFFIIAGQSAYAQAPGGATPPPPPVTVTELKAQNVSVPYEYAARVSAYRDVQVRARVGGILLHSQLFYFEGTEVQSLATLLFFEIRFVN
ncbi:RND family efflux transporter MFP subunit [Ochrobactrum sp. CDB2]|nr:RND family efflux transporter MFP subunit [Ochrobactrum sp. CDB2]